jgi:hypothetical protein
MVLPSMQLGQVQMGTYCINEKYVSLMHIDDMPCFDFANRKMGSNFRMNCTYTLTTSDNTGSSLHRTSATVADIFRMEYAETSDAVPLLFRTWSDIEFAAQADPVGLRRFENMATKSIVEHTAKSARRELHVQECDALIEYVVIGLLSFVLFLCLLYVAMQRRREPLPRAAPLTASNLECICTPGPPLPMSNQPPSCNRLPGGR